MNKPLRRPLNVSIDADLVIEARALALNVSRACEAGLDAAVRDARRARWLAENKDAIEASNSYVERHGLPLERYRIF